MNLSINRSLSFHAAQFQQQFPDWIPSKPFSAIQSMMAPRNNGKSIDHFHRILD